MTKEELKEYLVDEAKFSEEEVDNMSDYELFDSYLKWNGIIGWTYDIVDAIEHLNLKNRR